MIELDLLHIISNYWLYPMLGLAIVLVLVQRPSFQSAANFHIFLTTSLFVIAAGTLIIPLLPSWELSLVPARLVEFTQMQVHLESSGNSQWLLYGSMAVYFLGLSWILIYTLLGIMEAQDISRRASEPGQDLQMALQDIEHQLKSLFQLNTSVKVLMSEEVKSPFVWRIKQPLILLPQASASWQHDRLLRVMAHEYAHIERRDWLYKLLSRCAVALFWCVPTAWMVSRKIDWYAEVACDDRVVQLLDCRGEYADDLMTLATDVKHSIFALSYLRGSELYQRISMVLDPCRQKHRYSVWQRWLVLTVLALLFLPLASSRLKASTVYENIFDLGVFPEPASVPLLALPENSPIANNANRLRWLEQQMRLENKSVAPQQDENKTADAGDKKLLQMEKSYQKAIAARGSIRSTEAMLVVHRPHQHKAFSGFSTAELNSNASIATPDIAIKGYIPTQVVTPEYPKYALNRNITGRVVVQFDVDENGLVLNPRIVSAQPKSVFNKAVLKAIKEFRFTPLTMGDKPVITKNVTETFVFTIKGTADDNPKRGA